MSRNVRVLQKLLFPLQQKHVKFGEYSLEFAPNGTIINSLSQLTTISEHAKITRVCNTLYSSRTETDSNASRDAFRFCYTARPTGVGKTWGLYRQ